MKIKMDMYTFRHIGECYTVIFTKKYKPCNETPGCIVNVKKFNDRFYYVPNYLLEDADIHDVTDYVKELLLPCPFCGGRAVIKMYDNPESGVGWGIDGYSIICVDCGSAGSLQDKEEEAVKKWNERKDKKKYVCNIQ